MISLYSFSKENIKFLLILKYVMQNICLVFFVFFFRHLFVRRHLLINQTIYDVFLCWILRTYKIQTWVTFNKKKINFAYIKKSTKFYKLSSLPKENEWMWNNTIRTHMTARQLNIIKDLKQNYIKGIQFRKKI